MALLLTPLRWALSSILRVAIFAGLLLALYLFLLKPKIEGGERTVGRSLHSLEQKASPDRLGHCIGNAGGDVHKLQRCARIF